MASLLFAQATANNNTVSLVAAATGLRVYVVSYTLDYGAAGTGTIQDITANTARLIVNGVAANAMTLACAGTREAPLFASGVGDGLEIVSSAAVPFNVTVAYYYAP